MRLVLAGEVLAVRAGGGVDASVVEVDVSEISYALYICESSVMKYFDRLAN